MTVEIIQPIACKNCTHAFWQGQNEYLCRRYPPTAVTVLGPGKNGPEVKGVFGIYKSAYPSFLLGFGQYMQS